MKICEKDLACSASVGNQSVYLCEGKAKRKAIGVKTQQKKLTKPDDIFCIKVIYSLSFKAVAYFCATSYL